MITGDMLRAVPLLAGVADSELNTIAARAADVSLHTNEWLIQEGELPAFFIALSGRLTERLGDQLLAPVGGRHDTTEIIVGPGQLTAVMTRLHDDPDLRFELLADLAGVDTGTVLQVVYHLWSPLSPGS